MDWLAKLMALPEQFLSKSAGGIGGGGGVIQVYTKMTFM